MKIIENKWSSFVKKSRENINEPLNLGENKITSFYEPIAFDDLTNKEYADSRKYIKNSVGLIPEIFNDCGFIILLKHYLFNYF